MITATYITHSGDDLLVVNAARVSFAKRSQVEMVEVDTTCTDPDRSYAVYEARLADRDKKLIRYLAKHGHWTPFAHPQVTLHIKAPVFVRTQCFKHKVGFVENEVSRRYVDDEPEFYDPGNWRVKADDKKQGSGRGVVASPAVHVAYDDAMIACARAYRTLIQMNVAPEQARMVLPQAMMTEWYWTGSLAAYARFCNLRRTSDAQGETRELAHRVAAVVQPLFPVSWEALTA